MNRPPNSRARRRNSESVISVWFGNVILSGSPALNRWPLKSREKNATYQVHGHTRTDNSSVLLTLVRQGVGMARLFDLISGPLIRQGELVPVLQDQIDNQPVPIFAVMRQERHRLPKIRACIDFWAESIAAMTPP